MKVFGGFHCTGSTSLNFNGAESNSIQTFLKERRLEYQDLSNINTITSLIKDEVISINGASQDTGVIVYHSKQNGDVIIGSATIPEIGTVGWQLISSFSLLNFLK